jgi:hypothetical protein
MQGQLPPTARQGQEWSAVVLTRCTLLAAAAAASASPALHSTPPHRDLTRFALTCLPLDERRQESERAGHRQAKPRGQYIEVGAPLVPLMSALAEWN